MGNLKPECLNANLGCLSFAIPEVEMKHLDEISKIKLGFPHDFLVSDTVKEVAYGGTFDQIENHRRMS